MTAEENNNSEESRKREDPKPPKKRGWPFWIVFLVSGWMFFLGVLVGRGTSPVNFDIDDLGKKIARLKKMALKAEEMKAQEADPVSPDVKSELEFYEALKTAEKRDPLVLARREPKVDIKTETTRQSQPSSAIPNITAKTEKSLDSKKNNEVKTKAPDNESEINIEKTGRQYSIQVASLKDQAEADRLVEKYKARGYRAYRASAEVRNSGVWHRVRIGPFTNQSEALQILVPVSRESKGALIIEHTP